MERVTCLLPATSESYKAMSTHNIREIREKPWVPGVQYLLAIK